ncbi:hypothetical protein [Paenibacillus sp. PDC88]|uniref:Uncharacterized protein n=1 Tax=Paenibacillus provencensis TaxID=441151 RepID=A0ABW3Q0Y9_9BACL|nr:hypothetical protein [Paenibacillus sp. PDC88]SDX62907.1 hypothetical protein SAMN05518848_11077 [Paenibacillus sp. PDC88]
MNVQLVEQLQTETYFMLNLEITFTGLKEWFHMAGMQCDDVSLFQSILMPEKISPEKQVEFAQLILYRHEDVFFQMHRGLSADEPLHQLLIQLLNVRTLHGEETAILDLWEKLNLDRKETDPKYRSIYELFSN